EDVPAFGAHFRSALRFAAENPAALYRFFQLYNFLNAGIASTIASLVGNIGQSRKTFIDASIAVCDGADYAFEIAEQVKKASVDEYADPKFKDQTTGAGVSHRLLAIGIMQAVGDYAELSADERNAFKIPSWLEKLTTQVQRTYSGRKNDLHSLARAIGAHIFSEFSADDVEFNFACQELFVDRRGRGFHAYLKKHPTVTVQGKTFPAHSWLMSHGGYDPKKNAVIHGVEYTHLLTGYEAVRIMYDRAPAHEKAAIAKAVFEGIHQFRDLLDTFFVRTEAECRKLSPSRPVARKRKPSSPSATV
ncbi:MAG: hypothetical protein SFW62_02670, partial [Alphaproteobacteria bacterium]|nr:hypothetical protein [Alphaproteobacteria bacterium]